jgi:hypothetical protein
MKTYAAKSSVKRAIVKTFGLEVFEAGSVHETTDGKFCFEPAVVEANVYESPVILEKAVPAPTKKVKPTVVKTETKTVQVKHVKDLTSDRRKSDIKNPCKIVWDIAEKMLANGAKRKDIIAECENQGIAFYTARTQYQKYTSAMKASK